MRIEILVHDGKLVCYTPAAGVGRVVAMPVKKVTSVMFGGPDLDGLYVTTMAKPLPPRRGLFTIHDLGVRDVPEMRFAG